MHDSGSAARLLISVVLAAFLLAIAGCTSHTETSVNASFQPAEPFDEDAVAVTYDEGALPAGSDVELTASSTGDGSTYTLVLDSVQADRDFGAHLHTDPCGQEPEDSGPHYQDEPDPEQPSTDPEYANPENEVWLDLTTDGAGHGESEATVDWLPRSGEANSVVLHQRHTATAEGEAGAAGDRLGCVNVSPDFD
ncbi:superoxide dismutase family protein [Phytoactinopolyspora halophila]|nr:superoxide dismutase family protein [Phytoactinopolyspora halophila]